MNENQPQFSPWFSHNVYKNDPVSLKSYVNRMMSVKTNDGCVHNGYVYTVDPVSESIVLINPNDKEFNMKIVMGHAIIGMEFQQETEAILPDLFLSQSAELSDSVILQRKNAIRELLLENRFPVREFDNVLNIQGIVSIEPPYDLEHCISSNEIVLLRVQKLISSMII